MPNDKTTNKGITDNPEANVDATNGYIGKPVDNRIQPSSTAKEMSKIIKVNKQKQIDNNNRGFVPLYRPSKGIQHTVNTSVIDARDYNHYLGDKNGFIPSMSKKDLDFNQAQQQSTLNVINNTIGPNQIANIGVNLVREVGKAGELFGVIAGDYTFSNALMDWADDAQTELKRDGMTTLSKYPDEMVGDFRGFMGLIGDVVKSAGTFALEGAGIGKVFNLVGKSVINGLKLGAKGASIISKTTKGLSSFAVTGFESADVAIGAYDRTLSELTQTINPLTGTYYTEDEAKNDAELASKRAFWLNQAVVTGLNYTSMSSIVMPELQLEKAVLKTIGEKSIVNLKNQGIKGIKNSIDDIVKADVQQQAKQYARREFGPGRILLEGTQEGIEELGNSYAENVALMSVMNGTNWHNELTNPEVLSETIGTKESMWNFISGFIGGAGQHMIMGNMPSMDALGSKEIVNRTSDGRAVYVDKDIKDKEAFVSPDDKLTEQLYKDNNKILSTTKQPTKPVGYKKAKKGEQQSPEFLAYEEASAEFNTARRKEFFTRNYKKAQRDYIDMFENKGKVLKDAYIDVQRNFDIIEQQIAKKKEGKDYDVTAIDKAKNEIFNVGAVYNVKNGTSENFKAIYDVIENMSQTEAIDNGLAIDENDTSYKERAKVAKKDVDTLTDEYDRISKKFWDKDNIIGGTMVDILFGSFVMANSSKRDKKQTSKRVENLLKESELNKQSAESLIGTLVTKGKMSNKDKVDTTVSKLLENHLATNKLNIMLNMKNSIYNKRLNSEADKAYKRIIGELTSEEQWSESHNKLYTENKELIDMMASLIVTEAIEEATNNTNVYMKQKSTRESILDSLRNQARDHINKSAAKEVKEDNKKRIEKEEKQEDDIIKDEEIDIQKEEAELQKEIVTKNRENASMDRTIDDKINQIDKLYTELESTNPEDASGIEKEMIDLVTKFTALDKDAKVDEKKAFIIEENKLIDKLVRLKNKVNNKTEPTSDNKNKFSSETVDKLKNTIDNISANSTVISDEEFEEDDAIEWSDGIDIRTQQEALLDFRVALFEMYEQWKNFDNIKNSNPNLYLHYVEFYKTFVDSIGGNKAILKELYKNVIDELMSRGGTKINKQDAINSKIRAMDIHGNLASVNQVDEETTFDYNDDETKPLKEIDIKNNQTEIYDGLKLTSPSNSLGYNERNYIEVTTNGVIRIEDIDNVKEGKIWDKLRIGDSITMEILDDNSIPVSKKDGTKTTWGQLKEELPKSEHSLHIPIITKRDNDIIGFVHDRWFLENDNRNVADTVDLKAELKNLNDLRNNIINKKKITTKITTIKNGHLNIDFENTSRTLETHNPNLNKLDNPVVIYKNGAFRVKGNKEVNVNVINKKFIDSIQAEGVTFILYPNSDNTGYFAQPAKIPTLGELGNEELLKSIDKVISNLVYGIPIEGITTKSDIVDFFKNLVYTKSFNFDTIDKGDENNYRYFFNITKSGDIQFAHTDPQLTLNSQSAIYTIKLSGKEAGTILETRRDLDTGKPINKQVEEVSKQEVLGLLSNILKNKYLNINIDNLGTFSEFKMPIYNGSTLVSKTFDNYYDFISKYIKTPVIEKIVENDDGTVSYSYTVQPTIEFEAGAKAETIEETPIIGDEVNITPLGTQLEDNEEFEEYDEDDAVIYSDETLESLDNEIIRTESGLSYEEEQDIIELIVVNILDQLDKKSIDDTQEINTYFKNLVEDAQKFLNDLRENPTGTSEQMADAIKLHEALVDHMNIFKGKVIADLTSTLGSMDITEKLLVEETEEFERKPQWDILNNARNTMEKASLKLKMIFRTTPIAYFKTDNKNEILYTKNKKPRIVYKKNSVGYKKMQDSRNITDKIQNILINYSHVNSKDKFNKFVEVLENSGDAELYLVAQKIKNADDNTKAAFINTTSVQDSDVQMNMFKSESIEVENEYGEIYNKTVNKVFSVKISKNAMLKKIVDDFGLNAQSNPNSKTVIKKDGNVVINIDQLNTYLKSIKDDTFTITDMKLLLSSVGIILSDAEYKHITNNKYALINAFDDKDITSIEYIFNHQIKWLIDSIIELGDTTDVNILNPLTNVNKSILEGFAKIKLAASKRYGTTTHRNGEGNKMQSITLNTMLSRTLGQLKAKGSSMLAKLSDAKATLTGMITKGGKSTDWFKSFWVSEMDKGNQNLFSNGIGDTLSKLSKYAKPKHKTNMSADEIFVDSTFMWLNNNKKIFRFAPLTFADKRTPAFLEVPRFKLDVDKYIDSTTMNMYKTKDGMIDPTVDSNLIQAIYYYIIKPETARINRHIEQIQKGAITEDSVGSKEFYGGNFFYFSPSLNNMKDIRNEDGTIIMNPDTKMAMINEVVKTIMVDVKDNYTMFNKVFMTDGSKGKKRIKLLDSSYMDKNYHNKFDSNVNDDILLQHMALEYTFNYRLATAEYMKNVGSYPSSTFKSKILTVDNYNTYKDNFVKLINEKGGEIESAVKSTINEYTKRMAKDIAPRMDGYWVDSRGNDFSNFTQMYTAEDDSNANGESRYGEVYENLGIEGYNKFEAADAQEWSTFKEYIINAHAYSNISDELYNKVMDLIDETEAYNKKLIVDIEKEGKTHIEVLKAMKSLELPQELKSTLSVVNTKPVYAGKIWNESLGRFTSRYIKVATLALVPDITRNTKIDMLRRQAEYIEVTNNTSVRIAMTSGVKEGANNIKKIFTKNVKGEMKVDNKQIAELTGEVLNRDGFGIQLEEPISEVKTKINLVSQANKLLFNGLLTGFPEIDGDSSMKGFTLDEKEYSAKQLRNLKEDIRKEIVTQQVDKLLNELGLQINKETESLELTGANSKEQFMKKLHGLIKHEMNTRNYNVADLLAIGLIENNSEFRFPLDFVPSSSKIEALLLSIITNRVIKTKIPGKNYVNTAPNGMMEYNKEGEYMNDMTYTSSYNGKSLQYIRFDEGEKTIEYAQCFAPFNFTDSKGKLINVEDLIEIKNGKRMIDPKKMDKELLKLIGLRIPNQEKVSMLTLEIVGFLPKYMKGMIILPPEITAQMGSDNDYDHLFTYAYNTDKNARLESVNKIKDEIRKKHSYNNHIGSEEYEVWRIEMDKLNKENTKVYFNGIRATLESDELAIFNKISKEGYGKFKKQTEFTEKEQIIKDKIAEYDKVHVIEGEDRIRELRLLMENERKAMIKEEIIKETSDIQDDNVLRKLKTEEVVKDNDTNQLQNKYIDVFHSVLSNPEVTKLMLSPLDKPYLGKESDMLVDIMQKDKSFDPMSLSYAIDAYINNQTGKVGVAVQSLVSTFLALSEDKQLNLSEELIQENPIIVNTVNGPIIMKHIGLGQTTLEDGTPITNSLINMMFQNEAVDNAKQLKLAGINYNKNTAPIYNALMVMKDEKGNVIPLETLTRLMSQEVMTMFTEQMANKGSSISDIKSIKTKQIFKNIKSSFETKFDEANTSLPNINYNNFILETPTRLLNNIKTKSNNTETAEYYQYQAQLANFMANIYENYIEPIDSLIMNVSGIDSKSIGKNILEMNDRHKRITEAVYNNETVPNATNLLKFDGIDTELGHIFKSSYDLAKDLYIRPNILGKSLFGYYSPIYTRVSEIMKKRYKVEANFIDDKKAVWTGFKKYIMASSFQQVKNENTQDMRKEMLFGNDSLVMRTLNYKTTKWFKNNDFLSQLKWNINENKLVNIDDKWTVDGKNPMYLEFNSFIDDKSKDYNNIASLFKLFVTTNKDLNNDPTNKALEDRLDYLQAVIDYTVLESGIQNAHNWMKYIHPSYLEQTGLLSQLRNYQSQGMYDADLIVKQILKHNIELINNVKNLHNQDEIELSYEKDTQNILSLSFNPLALKEQLDNISPNDTDNDLLDLISLLMDEEGVLPQMIRHYNKETDIMEIFEQSEQSSESVEVVYNRVNPLGSIKLGTDEYGPDVTDTILPENTFVSNATKEDLNNGPIAKDAVNEKTDSLYGQYEDKPSKETVFNIVNELAKEDDTNGIVAKIIQQFPSLYEQTIFLTVVDGKRGTARYKQGSYKLQELGIDMKSLRDRNDTAEDIDNEFKELLLHEMLHAIYRRIDYKVKNKIATKNEVEIFNQLEVLRETILKEMIANNPELYKSYLEHKANKTKPTKEMTMLFEPYKNVTEMLSYGWTNSIVQNNMKSVVIEGKTGYKRFIDLLNQLLKDILKKFDITDTNNSLSKFLELSTQLYENELNEMEVKPETTVTKPTKQNEIFDKTESLSKTEIKESKLKTELNKLEDIDNAVDYTEKLNNIVKDAHKNC